MIDLLDRDPFVLASALFLLTVLLAALAMCVHTTFTEFRQWQRGR